MCVGSLLSEDASAILVFRFFFFHILFQVCCVKIIIIVYSYVTGLSHYIVFYWTEEYNTYDNFIDIIILKTEIENNVPIH